MTATTQKMPFDAASFQVLYVGRFGKRDAYAVFVTRLDGKVVQINDTVRYTPREANAIARNLAQYDAVPWYGYAG
jgi:hypothetical protein